MHCRIHVCQAWLSKALQRSVSNEPAILPLSSAFFHRSNIIDKQCCMLNLYEIRINRQTNVYLYNTKFDQIRSNNLETDRSMLSGQ